MSPPVSDEGLLKQALSLDADDKLLVESIREAKNIRFNILTMVLNSFLHPAALHDPGSLKRSALQRVLLIFPK